MIFFDLDDTLIDRKAEYLGVRVSILSKLLFGILKKRSMSRGAQYHRHFLRSCGEISFAQQHRTYEGCFRSVGDRVVRQRSWRTV